VKPEFFLRGLRGAEAPLFHGISRQGSKFLHCALAIGGFGIEWPSSGRFFGSRRPRLSGIFLHFHDNLTHALA